MHLNDLSLKKAYSWEGFSFVGAVNSSNVDEIGGQWSGIFLTGMCVGKNEARVLLNCVQAGEVRKVEPCSHHVPHFGKDFSVPSHLPEEGGHLVLDALEESHVEGKVELQFGEVLVRVGERVLVPHHVRHGGVEDMLRLVLMHQAVSTFVEHGVDYDQVEGGFFHPGQKFLLAH